MIEHTQSAIVLENLVNKFFANYQRARAATAIAPRTRSTQSKSESKK